MSFGTILNSWFLIWKRNKNLVPNPSLKSIHVVNTYYIPELMWRDTFIFIHSTNIYWESIMCQTLKWTPKKKKKWLQENVIKPRKEIMLRFGASKYKSPHDWCDQERLTGDSCWNSALNEAEKHSTRGTDPAFLVSQPWRKTQASVQGFLDS